MAYELPNASGLVYVDFNTAQNQEDKGFLLVKVLYGEKETRMAFKAWLGIYDPNRLRHYVV
jgi:hypothetical protein